MKVNTRNAPDTEHESLTSEVGNHHVIRDNRNSSSDKPEEKKSLLSNNNCTVN